ncbi:hypothetical protein PsorP6_008956 [Peronosclerospora sorghi]|uniref:Uncharacterized protein n=1 Tax=Peronosclerospora sorghi TaxID=230839 RepID=A0ACC0VZE7_9STRA|nr:hypothetical protein PsorP6_008956 [Peronosclerospora sorghi]
MMVKRGEFPDRIKDLMHDQVVADKIAKFNVCDFFSKNFRTDDQYIHVLMDLGEYPKKFLRYKNEFVYMHIVQEYVSHLLNDHVDIYEPFTAMNDIEQLSLMLVMYTQPTQELTYDGSDLTVMLTGT